MSKYYIAESAYKAELIEEIEHLISKGWEPLGGVAVYHEHKDSDDIEGHTTFYQAVIRRF